MSLEVTPLTGTIGAAVEGIDLRQPLSDDLVQTLEDLLHEWLVLVFPLQHLSDEQHVQLAEAFGQPNVNPNSEARGVSHPLEWIEDTPDSPPKADLWHTDVSFLAEPPDLGFLASLVTPGRGGDTLWADLHAAYEALSPEMQHIADGLHQTVHPGDGLREALRLQFGEGVWERVTDMYQGTTHPLVRVHPDTGRKALFLCGAYFKGLVGFTDAESSALMSIFRAPLAEPAIQCRWRWSEGDIAIWDERCTNHRGLGDHFPRHRLVRRCTVGGSRPVGPLGTKPGVGREIT